MQTLTSNFEVPGSSPGTPTIQQFSIALNKKSYGTKESVSYFMILIKLRDFCSYGCNSVGRMLGLGPSCRQFESGYPYSP